MGQGVGSVRGGVGQGLGGRVRFGVCGIRVGCVGSAHEWSIGQWGLCVGGVEWAVMLNVMDICYFIGKSGRSSSVSPQHVL